MGHTSPMLFADQLTLDAPRRTADGYLAVRARAARTGVYRYTGREVDPEAEYIDPCLELVAGKTLDFRIVQHFGIHAEPLAHTVHPISSAVRLCFF